MNILHVLSQQEVTGAETYAATLADEQVRNGHNVLIVSDTFYTETLAEIRLLPVGKRDFPERLRNVAAIRRILREKSIDVVHAHSRAASWVSYFATRRGRVPLVSTIHGRQHVHLSSRIFRIYGEKILAVCESIRDQMIHDLGIDKRRVEVVRNGILPDQWHSKGKPRVGTTHKTIALVGRTSGPKGRVMRTIITEVFPRVLKSCPNAELQIVGGMNETAFVRDLVSATNEGAGAGKVSYAGFVQRIRDTYRRSAVVIGSGRVAMEALATGAPVIAFGETNYIGRLSKATARQGLETNFGDASIPTPADPEIVARDIVAALKSGEANSSGWGESLIADEYDIKRIGPKVIAAYAEAAAVKAGIKEIPVLMYHRITAGKPRGTRHGIYVTSEDFERQLLFLRKKGYAGLTFSDMREICSGMRPMPQRPLILTFDDGYEDNYLNAFPLLKSCAFPAVVFLVGDRNIRNNAWDLADGEAEVPLMSETQIREMAHHGIEFGAHSMTHQKLTELSLKEVQREIRGSKRAIERRVGGEVISFAYPYGKLNEEIKRLVKDAGFTFGIASDSGPRTFWGDFFEIRRIQVFPDTSMFSFWKKSSGWYHRYKNVA